jgi:asparagine synthase (glutamine-hydrolysing)
MAHHANLALSIHRRRLVPERSTAAAWGCSSAGRAPALQAGGQGFESPHLHHREQGYAALSACNRAKEPMPGLTVVAGSDVHASAVLDAARSVARPLDRVELLFDLPHRLAVVWSAHDGYPLRTLSVPDGFAVLEGSIPSLTSSARDAQLQSLLGAMHSDGDHGYDAACRWLSGCDGDFLLFLFSPHAKRALLATDALGRLRPFVRHANAQVAFAREIKTLIALYGAQSVDRIALAQILTFSFPLGDRTPVAGIRAVAPGAVARIDLEPFRYRMSSYRTWDFEALAQRRDRKIVPDLAACFRETCAAQARLAGHGPVLVSLSGGMDSRTVAAGLASAGIEFSAATFTTAHGAHDADLPVAQRVADTLQVPWQHYVLHHPTWNDCVETALLRDGLNDIAMAPVVAFLKRIQTERGARTLHFSGDGGNELTDRRCPWWVRTFDDFLGWCLEQHFWPPRIAATLAGVAETELREEIAARLQSYPERGLRYRGVHFRIIDRAMRWLCEGEERNRSFVWHQSPFFGTRFFEMAMSVDPRQKQGDRLRAELLAALDSRLAAIPPSNRTVRRLGTQLPPGLRSALRPAIRRFRKDASLAKDGASGTRVVAPELRSLLKSSVVRETFAGVDLEQVLTQATSRQFDLLATQIVNMSQRWGTVRA